MSVRSAVLTQRNIGGGMLPSIRPDLLPTESQHIVFGMQNSRGKLVQRRRLREAVRIVPIKQIVFGSKKTGADVIFAAAAMQTSFGLNLPTFVGQPAQVTELDVNPWEFTFSREYPEIGATSQNDTFTYSFGLSVRGVRQIDFKVVRNDRYATASFEFVTSVETVNFTNSTVYNIPQGVTSLQINTTAPESVTREWTYGGRGRQRTRTVIHYPRWKYEVTAI